MRYPIELLCPPLNEVTATLKRVQGFTACPYERRPVCLKIKGGRLPPQAFLKEVRVDGSMSLYKGTWALARVTLDLIRKGKLEVLPLARTDKPKPPTHKQKELILKLCKELNEIHPIPETRKEASDLIQTLISRKRARKTKKEVQYARTAN